MHKHTYIAALVGILAVPTAVLFMRLKSDINIENIFMFVIILGCAGVIADIWATRQNSKDRTWIWEFNPKNIVSSKILGHPLEEYVYFILFLPYVVLFWELLNKVASGTAGTKDTVISVAILLWLHLTALYLYHSQKVRIASKHKSN